MAGKGVRMKNRLRIRIRHGIPGKCHGSQVPEEGSHTEVHAKASSRPASSSDFAPSENLSQPARTADSVRFDRLRTQSPDRQTASMESAEAFGHGGFPNKFRSETGYFFAASTTFF